MHQNSFSAGGSTGDPLVGWGGGHPVIDLDASILRPPSNKIPGYANELQIVKFEYSLKTVHI